MNFQVLQLQEQLRKTQEDNEFRFQQLEKKPAGKKTELETPAGVQPNKEAAAAAASDPSATAAATPPAAAAATQPRTVEEAASTQIGEDSVGDTAGIPAAGQTMPPARPPLQIRLPLRRGVQAAQPPANAPNEMANMKPGTLGSLIFNGDGRIVETTRNPADNSADTLPGVKPGLPPSQGAAKQATAPAAAATTPAPPAAASKPMEQASITPKASATVPRRRPTRATSRRISPFSAAITRKPRRVSNPISTPSRAARRQRTLRSGWAKRSIRKVTTTIPPRRS